MWGLVRDRHFLRESGISFRSSTKDPSKIVEQRSANGRVLSFPAMNSQTVERAMRLAYKGNSVADPTLPTPLNSLTATAPDENQLSVLRSSPATEGGSGRGSSSAEANEQFRVTQNSWL